MAIKPAVEGTQPRHVLTCIECGRNYDPEGWDPMGGDCPVVKDSETGEIIRPEETMSTPSQPAPFREWKCQLPDGHEGQCDVRFVLRAEGQCPQPSQPSQPAPGPDFVNHTRTCSSNDPSCFYQAACDCKPVAGLEEAARELGPNWETPCPKREDKQHCNCWYDGEECCACGDPKEVEDKTQPDGRKWFDNWRGNLHDLLNVAANPKTTPEHRLRMATTFDDYTWQEIERLNAEADKARQRERLVWLEAAERLERDARQERSGHASAVLAEAASWLRAKAEELKNA